MRSTLALVIIIASLEGLGCISSSRTFVELDMSSLAVPGVFELGAPDSILWEGAQPTPLVLEVLLDTAVIQTDTRRIVLTGRVIERDNLAELIHDATILLGEVGPIQYTPQGGRFIITVSSRTVTNSQGRFRIEGPVSESIRLIVTAPLFSTRQYHIGTLLDS